MKKKFIDKKIGKFLTKPTVKAIIKSIPILGDIAGNVLDEQQTSEPGQIDKKTIGPQLVKIAILGILLYLAMTGKISFEEAEQAKEFINTP